MNSIKKIARKFGFDIVRYSKPTVAANTIQKSIVKHKPIISHTLALNALESVGRKSNIPAFTYYNRPNKSSDSMEEAENIWWNAHGRLIEKVWVLSEDVNNLYRKNYVLQAASFFKQENKKVKILDLGCGSGWFGRMIADKELEYYGMDFSSTQIEIANSEKEKSSNNEHLNYYCLSDFRKIENLNDVTGVVIHAFLHHLYWDELHKLFQELSSVLPTGCKFFIVEPIYPNLNDTELKEKATVASANLFVKQYQKYIETLKHSLINKRKYDIHTEAELSEIISESSENGFFFSPKEVPFRLGEFTSFISKYLHIERIFMCGMLDTETAQFVDRIQSKEEKQYYSELLFPFVNSLDQFLISNKCFELNQYAYQFTAFQCILKK